jgi:hypothetical protein
MICYDDENKEATAQSSASRLSRRSADASACLFCILVPAADLGEDGDLLMDDDEGDAALMMAEQQQQLGAEITPHGDLGYNMVSAIYQNTSLFVHFGFANLLLCGNWTGGAIILPAY